MKRIKITNPFCEFFGIIFEAKIIGECFAVSGENVFIEGEFELIS